MDEPGRFGRFWREAQISPHGKQLLSEQATAWYCQERLKLPTKCGPGVPNRASVGTTKDPVCGPEVSSGSQSKGKLFTGNHCRGMAPSVAPVTLHRGTSYAGLHSRRVRKWSKSFRTATPTGRGDPSISSTFRRGVIRSTINLGQVNSVRTSTWCSWS